MTFALLATASWSKRPWCRGTSGCPTPTAPRLHRCACCSRGYERTRLFGLARTWETVFAGAVGPAEHRIRLVLAAREPTALVATAMALVERHPAA